MMTTLTVSYEVDKLLDLVDERNRLINVLNIHPSTNDNIRLKKQLNKTLDILNEFEEFDSPDFIECINKYNECINDIKDNIIDNSLYLFKKRVHQSKSRETDIKKVRFKPNLVENEPQNEVEDNKLIFSPNSEYIVNSDKLIENKIKLFDLNVKNDLKNVTNPSIHYTTEDLKIQQQFYLNEQDSHLERLSEAINRTHGISLDINQEITQQTDDVLVDLENLIDSSDRNLSNARKRLTAFELSLKENRPYFIICILLLVLIILLIL